VELDSCHVETICRNRGVLRLVMWSCWSQLTLSSYTSLALGPIHHNDIIASHKSFVLFDTDKVSMMGANLLTGRGGQPAHVIPSFLLNLRLLQDVVLQW